MDVKEIKVMRESIQTELDDLHELREVLYSIENVVRYFTGQPRDDFY